MVRIIRAHFDGKVFVPDEPVTDAPINQPLRLQYENGQQSEYGRPIDQSKPEKAVIAERLRKLKSITGIVTGPPIDPESLRRENLYDDRAAHTDSTRHDDWSEHHPPNLRQRTAG